MMMVRALYRLRSSGATFRALLCEVLHYLSYVPSKANPDVFIRSAVKSNDFQYDEYILYYVDNIICISDNPSETIFGLQDKFKLKDDNIEDPSTYLGVQFTK